jgi:hypothetical protein
MICRKRLRWAIPMHLIDWRDPSGPIRARHSRTCEQSLRSCPDALLLNYSNPMAMLTWAMNRATNRRTTGLWHNVFGTARELSHVLDIPVDGIDYLCAGINHMAFYLRFEQMARHCIPCSRSLARTTKPPPLSGFGQVSCSISVTRWQSRRSISASTHGSSDVRLMSVATGCPSDSTDRQTRTLIDRKVASPGIDARY